MVKFEYKKKHKFYFSLKKRFMSYGKDMWYKRNCVNSIEISENSYAKSKIKNSEKMFFKNGI